MSHLIGTKVKTLRKKKDLTLEQLASRIGSGKSYIWELENKGVKRPSAEKLTGIANALDVTTDYLIDDELTEMNDGIVKEVSFRKFARLKPDDQARIMDMMDAWGRS